MGAEKREDESKLYIFIELVTIGSLRNLYQRDIKCANILMDANGSVKLDFGLAMATKLTDVKSWEGTAFWMAPEVVKGKNKGYGLPADVWSLGCTVLEMLTGKIPYSNLECVCLTLADACTVLEMLTGKNPYSNLECISALFRIGKGELPPIPDTLSRDAKDFILQCLQVNP
ncbi:mitogen-activated protein kinase kinase kinase 1-like protein, partial [Trifolium pratense]